jgi:hypothetical protein
MTTFRRGWAEGRQDAGRGVRVRRRGVEACGQRRAGDVKRCIDRCRSIWSQRRLRCPEYNIVAAGRRALRLKTDWALVETAGYRCLEVQGGQYRMAWAELSISGRASEVLGHMGCSANEMGSWQAGVRRSPVEWSSAALCV